MAAVPEWSFRREFDVEILIKCSRLLPSASIQTAQTSGTHRNTNNENGFYCVRAIVERIASLVLARNACSLKVYTDAAGPGTCLLVYGQRDELPDVCSLVHVGT